MMKKKLMWAVAGLASLAIAGAASAVEYSNENVVTTGTGRFGASNTASYPVGFPNQFFHLYRNDTSSVRFRLQNSTGMVDLSSSSGALDVWTNGNIAMRLMASGFVGIGNFNTLPTVPAQFLHLRRANSGPTRIRMENGEGFVEAGTDNNAYQVLTNNAVRMTILPDGKIGVGTTTPTQALDVVGTGRVQVLEITGGADLSEQFNVAPAANLSAQPGMVVCIDPARPGELVVSSKQYDVTVAGIISGAGGINSGMTMGHTGTIADGAHPVALTGRVYCYADASAGAIQPGDLLTTSDTPGHAMKVADHAKAQGAILGKAMTPLAAGEKGLILVLVTLQ